MIKTVNVELTKYMLVTLINNMQLRPMSTTRNLNDNALLSKYGNYKFDSWFWNDGIYELNINELKEILDELKSLDMILGDI